MTIGSPVDREGGRARHPDATVPLLTGDDGGAMTYGSRVFEVEVTTLSLTIRLAATVCRMPAGISRREKSQHRMVPLNSMNWPGKPLGTYRTVIELTVAATTTTGPRIEADLDTGSLPTRAEVTNEELATISLRPGEWHAD